MKACCERCLERDETVFCPDLNKFLCQGCVQDLAEKMTFTCQGADMEELLYA